MTKGLAVIGIDISTFQGTIDWGAVAQSKKVDFAYAKATEGETFADDQFARNWQTMKLRSVPRGAYHFFRFAGDPIRQADHFISVVQPEKGDLLPMVDVEVDDGVKSIDAKVGALASFIGRVEKALGGRRMVIYTGYGFWNGSMGGSDAFSGHPLWIAEYNSDLQPALPAGWNSWSIWQYSDAGSIPGIAGNVDLDRLNGDTLAPLLL
jgi:lysozyme